MGVLRRYFVCVLFFSLGSVQLYFIVHILGLGQLESSCPVNCKQSSFVGLLISNNGYQSILMITVLFRIEFHSKPRFKHLPGDPKKKTPNKNCFKLLPLSSVAFIMFSFLLILISYFFSFWTIFNMLLCVKHSYLSQITIKR